MFWDREGCYIYIYIVFSVSRTSEPQNRSDTSMYQLLDEICSIKTTVAISKLIMSTIFLFGNHA